MQLGFNTNVHYRAVQFHVQTEDSGRARPHVITHLYHQGVILASEKRQYSHLLGRDDLEASVRALMEGQHQAMLARLRAGALDAILEERLPQLFRAPRSEADTARGAPDTQPDGLAPPGLPRRPSRPRQAGHPDPPTPATAFGDDLEGEKPLDELILQYLVDNARRRSGSR